MYRYILTTDLFSSSLGENGAASQPLSADSGSDDGFSLDEP